jgi:beta-glucanase (GH16 family)
VFLVPWKTCFTGTAQVQISSTRGSQYFSMKFFHDFINGTVYRNLNKKSVHSLSLFFKKTFHGRQDSLTRKSDWSPHRDFSSPRTPTFLQSNSFTQWCCYSDITTSSHSFSYTKNKPLYMHQICIYNSSFLEEHERITCR